LSIWEKIRPQFWDQPKKEGQRAMDYRRTWQVNFVVACLITLIPISILVGYYGLRYDDGDGFLLWLLLGIIPLVLCAVYLGTVHQVNRIYQLDIYRNEVLKEIVYTHRLASVGRLASGVAHEINNPMAVIGEKAGLIQDLIGMDRDNCDWARVSSLLDDIQDNCQRASAITHRLLGFAKHLKLEIEPLDPVQLIKDVAGLFRQKSHYRGIEVVIEATPKEQTVHCDRGAMEQLVLTFLDNAFAVLPDGGELHIEVAQTRGNQLRLAFHDNGPGISKEDMHHLFEPFFSAGEKQQAGMGLCIAYGIVQKLGGEIHVESEPGQGAAFTVILPLEQSRELNRGAEHDMGRYALHAKPPGH
jgi:two-component system NtrC family sensor kinase